MASLATSKRGEATSTHAKGASSEAVRPPGQASERRRGLRRPSHRTKALHWLVKQLGKLLTLLDLEELERDPERVAVLGVDGPRRPRHGERLLVVPLPPGLALHDGEHRRRGHQRRNERDDQPPAAPARVLGPHPRRLLSHSPAGRLRERRG